MNNNTETIRKQSDDGNVFYLVAFTVFFKHFPSTASFLFKSEKEISLIEVYLKIHEQKLLKEFYDENGILTITNIQKL